MTATKEWSSALPRPVAFVLSGGASLGGIQVAMPRALEGAASIVILHAAGTRDAVRGRPVDGPEQSRQGQ